MGVAASSSGAAEDVAVGASSSSAATPSAGETLDADLRKSFADLKAANVSDHVKFFNRKEELIQLVDILSMDPLRVILLVGPMDSGKSALLSHLQELWTSESTIRKVLSPFLLINMRRKECTSPDELAVAMRSEIMSWHKVANVVLNGLKSVGTISGAPVGPLIQVLGDFIESFTSTSSSLGAIQDNIRLHVEMYANLRPVIVIDEANMLSTWEGKYDTELASLMHFFLWMTKETSKGHILMASSDNFFFPWIRKKLLSTKMLVLGLGYFNHENAKGFVSGHLLQDHDKQLKDGFEQAWSSIYQVTGGSPQQLKDIVVDARRFQSWHTACQNMLEAAQLEVEDGMLDEDAAKIMKLIVSKGGAVGIGIVKDGEFNGNATLTKSVVKRLVSDNLIHVRLWLAGMNYQDLNISKGDDKEYLMAISPASFAAMKSLLPPPQ